MYIYIYIYTHNMYTVYIYLPANTRAASENPAVFRALAPTRGSNITPSAVPAMPMI